MSSINGLGATPGVGLEGMQRFSALTDDQKATVQSILSQYDPKNLTADNAKSIFEQLRKAGINPGKGLKDALDAAGFDMKNMRALVMQSLQQAQSAQAASYTNQAAGLTDDQKTTVASILSKYDPKNLTAADAQSIFKQLSDAGIKPQKGLKDAIDAAGFNADQLRTLAMPERTNERHFWASQTAGSNQNINATSLQSLKSILDKFDLANMSSDDQTSLTDALQNAGLLQSGNLINLGA